jgi:hypothetical protein
MPDEEKILVIKSLLMQKYDMLREALFNKDHIEKCDTVIDKYIFLINISIIQRM